MSDLKDLQKFIEKHYPYIEPCVNCKYWRRGQSGQAFTKDSLWSKTAATHNNGPMCHYALDRDYPCWRENPLEILEGKCSEFKPR